MLTALADKSPPSTVLVLVLVLLLVLLLVLVLLLLLVGASVGAPATLLEAEGVSPLLAPL